MNDPFGLGHLRIGANNSADDGRLWDCRDRDPVGPAGLVCRHDLSRPPDWRNDLASLAYFVHFRIHARVGELLRRHLGRPLGIMTQPIPPEVAPRLPGGV